VRAAVGGSCQLPIFGVNQEADGFRYGFELHPLNTRKNAKGKSRELFPFGWSSAFKGSKRPPPLVETIGKRGACQQRPKSFFFSRLLACLADRMFFELSTVLF
jgi:hypothetical protein